MLFAIGGEGVAKAAACSVSEGGDAARLAGLAEAAAGSVSQWVDTASHARLVVDWRAAEADEMWEVRGQPAQQVREFAWVDEAKDTVGAGWVSGEGLVSGQEAASRRD